MRTRFDHPRIVVPLTMRGWGERSKTPLSNGNTEEVASYLLHAFF
jgi:hypothetical protein